MNYRCYASRIIFWVIVGALFVFTFWRIYNVLNYQWVELSPKQQIAEMNRRSAVATELRQVERGYLVEWKTGLLLRVASISNDRIILCYGDVCHGPNPIDIEAKRTMRVIRPNDPDWNEISFKYLRGERTK